MLVTVLWVIVSGVAKFDAKIAFNFPPDAFKLSLGFVLGLGGAMRIAMYDFLGYYDICYVGGEARDPERVIPRAIFLSVIFVALIYSVMNLCIIGVVPWQEAKQSQFIAALFMEKIYGGWAGAAISLLILWTALASVFALRLGYSRIPYAAALDGYFFRIFGRLHPSGQFPYVSLLVVGVLSMVVSLVDLGVVIDALLVARILVQFIGQIGAVAYLRRHRSDVARPFKMWLYPLPSLVALAGWSFLFFTADWKILLYGLGTVAAGLIAFAVWRTTAGMRPAQQR
jgi:amino acid transporter